jgi:hypothetical protein
MTSAMVYRDGELVGLELNNSVDFDTQGRGVEQGTKELHAYNFKDHER